MIRFKLIAWPCLTLVFFTYFNTACAHEIFNDFYDHMKYLSERDKVLSQNIQNSDTPQYLPKELYKQNSKEDIAFFCTNSAHMDLSNDSTRFMKVQAPIDEFKPNGNAVNLDKELFKKGENAMKLNEAVNVYNKSKALLNLAIVGNNK